jgi:hypothetical protein
MIFADEENLQRATFAPHLWVIAERKIPSPIFVVAIFGVDRFLRVPLPEGIATLTDEEQEQIVCRTPADTLSMQPEVLVHLAESLGILTGKPSTWAGLFQSTVRLSIALLARLVWKRPNSI